RMFEQDPCHNTIAQKDEEEGSQEFTKVRRHRFGIGKDMGLRLLVISDLFLGTRQRFFAGPHTFHDEFTDLGSDLRSHFTCPAIVNATVKTADGCFLSRFLEGIELPGSHAEFHFSAVRECEIVAEQICQYYRGGAGYHTVSTRIFRKWRCLQQRYPVFINVLVDVSLRPDKIAPVF